MPFLHESPHPFLLNKIICLSSEAGDPTLIRHVNAENNKFQSRNLLRLDGTRNKSSLDQHTFSPMVIPRKLDT